MEGKIVFKDKFQEEDELLIRYPTKNDAQEMCAYINTLSKERTFIRFQGEEVTLEHETQYLNGQLEKIAQKKAIQLLAIINGKLIGIADINMKDRVESHEGVFGISLLKEYRGMGIGRKLMETILKEAERNLEGIRLVTLSVFANNPLAHNFYKKLGFKEYGKLPGGVFHKGEYRDHIYMFREVKR